MLIYLADLVHNHFPGINVVPLNIAYTAAYAKSRFPDDVEIQLFKYCDEFLDVVRRKQPSIVGLSNYTWNESLNSFAGRYIKEAYPDMPIVMGGPNIRNDDKGIAKFLGSNDFVDLYITFAGEEPFAELLEKVLSRYPNGKFTGQDIRQFDIDSCFSLTAGILKGKHADESGKELDFIASPYLTGTLDKFLTPEFMPLFESNRGCPYQCSYCTWGSNARKKVRQFSRDRLRAEMEYVAKKGVVFPEWCFADANFGIFPRDVSIAKDIKEICDKYKPFHSVQIWWDKNARAHITEIARILKGLSSAYIAFQTFDPDVAGMINRKNITIDRLLEISGSLKSASDRLHTDILLGLPGETRESHLNSLRKAFELGFDSIGGGEIRMLKGSDLETDESREKYNIRTKYRLIQEGFGIYKGRFVSEFEESIRSTNWISEEEMIGLRILRAIFYSSITIGEFLPLMGYLRSRGVDVVHLMQKLIEMKDEDRLVAESIDWVAGKARSEWFDTKEEADKYFTDPAHQKSLLENPAAKLNYDFLSNLSLSKEHRDAFYDFMLRVIGQNASAVKIDIVRELLDLCRARNFIVRCLRGIYDTKYAISLSDDTVRYLKDAGYLAKGETSNDIVFAIDERVAGDICSSLQNSRKNIQAVSLLYQHFPVYFKPAH